MDKFSSTCCKKIDVRRTREQIDEYAARMGVK